MFFKGFWSLDDSYGGKTWVHINRVFVFFYLLACSTKTTLEKMGCLSCTMTCIQHCLYIFFFFPNKAVTAAAFKCHRHGLLLWLLGTA